MQGRSRASIARLYSWNYTSLGNLPNVLREKKYLYANPGLTYEYQFINVDDYEGMGETSPMPYFYQNLGEAESVVALYMYMRLTGYPADRISILTTYNGQLALISDVLHQRCAWNPAIGLPKTVATVDKYQGMQNDCKPHTDIHALHLERTYIHRHTYADLDHSVYTVHRYTQVCVSG